MNTETETKKVIERPGVRLLIGNLPFEADYKTIVEALSAHAKLLDLHVPAGNGGNANKGWGIARVPSDKADGMLNSTIALNGRILRVQLAN